MTQTKEEFLIDYLIKNNFSATTNKDLEKAISGMTAQQIIKAMEIAKNIQTNLNATSLGKELT
jgi:response regulator of citrate/malate metabolism